MDGGGVSSIRRACPLTPITERGSYRLREIERGGTKVFTEERLTAVAGWLPRTSGDHGANQSV